MTLDAIEQTCEKPAKNEDGMPMPNLAFGREKALKKFYAACGDLGNSSDKDVFDIAKRCEVLLVNVDGVPMVSGGLLFELHQTKGFPLCISIEQAYANGFVVAWDFFVERARSQG